VLASFYRWLVETGMLDTTPIAAVRRPSRDETTRQTRLTRHELADWLNTAETTGGPIYAMACLLLLNGLRVSEVCGIDLADLAEERWHHTVTIHGKRDMDATIPSRRPQDHHALTTATATASTATPAELLIDVGGDLVDVTSKRHTPLSSSTGRVDDVDGFGSTAERIPRPIGPKGLTGKLAAQRVALAGRGGHRYRSASRSSSRRRERSLRLVGEVALRELGDLLDGVEFECVQQQTDVIGVSGGSCGPDLHHQQVVGGGGHDPQVGVVVHRGAAAGPARDVAARLVVQP
jgi:hypothetical protein